MQDPMSLGQDGRRAINKDLVFCVEVLLFYELIHPFTVNTRGSLEAVWVSGQMCCVQLSNLLSLFFYLVFLVAVRAVKTALFFELYRLSYEVHAFKLCYKENIHVIHRNAS